MFTFEHEWHTYSAERTFGGRIKIYHLVVDQWHELRSFRSGYAESELERIAQAVIDNEDPIIIEEDD